jgi:hypothetical protein
VSPRVAFDYMDKYSVGENVHGRRYNITDLWHVSRNRAESPSAERRDCEEGGEYQEEQTSSRAIVPEKIHCRNLHWLSPYGSYCMLIGVALCLYTYLSTPHKE